MENGELARYGEENFFADILRILSEGRNKARAAVNLSMVETYWAIGRRIVEQEQQGKERANYGDRLLVNLSRYLGGTFIGIILCADKDATIAKYSVLSESRQVFASKYKLILPTEEELAAELERNVHYLREIHSEEHLR